MQLRESERREGVCSRAWTTKWLGESTGAAGNVGREKLEVNRDQRGGGRCLGEESVIARVTGIREIGGGRIKKKEIRKKERR